MHSEILIANLTNPTLLFFVLGILAVWVKSDLEIPAQSIKFISLYLLFAIGFKGGQELAHSEPNLQMGATLLFALVISALVPVYVFFLLRRRLGPTDAGAIAACYGSVSAVTFVAAVAFLEANGLSYSGYMVAVMALMESPAIIVGVLLIGVYAPKTAGKASLREVARHSLTNGSVFLIIGSLLIGWVADTKQAEGIRPFTTDIFKGFLAIFLLEMGMVTAKRIQSFRGRGLFAAGVAVLIPLINGVTIAVLSRFLGLADGDRMILATLAASASYIAVPAALKHSVPDADPGLYIPMAIGITFPFNIAIGMPIYFTAIGLTPI